MVIDAGAMGLTNNRPYPMNAATPPSTKLIGKKKLYSPRAAECSNRRQLRFDSGHRRQVQAHASKEFANSDEDEQSPRHCRKPGHLR